MAIIAAAMTLAACGSDKAAGPTTANNPQIIADMKDAYNADSGDAEQSTRLAVLDFAITALTIGAPVSSGSVTIDGVRYPFNFTSYSLELDDDSGTVNTVSIVTGWRHSNGDSLIVMVYAPAGSGIEALRGVPAVGSAQLRTPGSLGLADVSRMLRSATVSKDGAPANFELQIAAFVDGSSVWGAQGEDGTIHSGSISFSAAGGECDEDGLDELGGVESVISCGMQRSSVAANVDLSHIDSEDAAERTMVVDAQSVTGVKLVTQFGTP